MTARRPKGLWPAVTGVERIAYLRWRIYELYDLDDTVQDELARFLDHAWMPLAIAFRRLDDCLPDLPDAEVSLGGRAGADAAHHYFSDLMAVASRLGMDRLGLVGSPPVVVAGYLPSGLAQVHRYLWHLDKAILFETAPKMPRLQSSAVLRPTFKSLASFGTPLPGVNTTIAGTDERWDPRGELLVEARTRLRRATGLPADLIEAELERIYGEGRYLFPDTVTERSGISRLDRDVQWTWWRIRHRWPYRRIAEEWGRLHPGDIQLQAQGQDRDGLSPEDAGEPWPMLDASDAARQVRKAVEVFAGRARINVATGPGRRSHKT